MSKPQSSEQGGLRVSGLTKTYSGGVRALDGVDLAVAPGLYGVAMAHTWA